jgi:carboxymethylenebutenolidase
MQRTQAVPGLLLRADKPARQQGILLLQEIFGLNQSMRLTAQNFHNQGFDVFAPDLFWRQEEGVQLDPSAAGDREKAQSLMQGLDTQLAISDIAKSVEMLRGLDGATEKVAAVGYCLGGRMAYLAAASGLVDAAVSYYGVAIHQSLELADTISVPMLIHIAKDDHLCDAKAQKDMYDALAFRNNFTLHTHAGVGHAFARPNSDHWNERAADTANKMTYEFLRATIGNPNGS